MLPVKTVPEIIFYVSGGTLNLTRYASLVLFRSQSELWLYEETAGLHMHSTTQFKLLAPRDWEATLHMPLNGGPKLATLRENGSLGWMREV